MSADRDTDELLVAYLDNELARSQRQTLEQRLSQEPALMARLAWLENSSLQFKSAFQPLLAEAPEKRLQANLHRMLLPAQSGVTRRSVIAAAIGLLALGAAGDRAWQFFAQPEENWRGLVAQYLALYTPETLAGDPPSPQEIAAQLQHTGDRLGIALRQQQLLLAGAELRNARVLAYDGKRIAQLTYLDDKYGPLALCIIQQPGSEQPESERRMGMNVVYWSGGNHSFMLIGHNPPQQMSTFASQLQRSLAS